MSLGRFRLEDVHVVPAVLRPVAAAGRRPPDVYNMSRAAGTSPLANARGIILVNTPENAFYESCLYSIEHRCMHGMVA